MRRVAQFLVPAASLCALVLGSVCAVAQVVLVPYGSPGYRYALTVDAFPAGAELPNFNDASFPVATAPFGGANHDVVGPGVAHCSSGIYGATTPWPSDTYLTVRMHVILPLPAAGGQVLFGIADQVTIYVNGVLIGSVSSSGCARYNQYSLPIPDGVLRQGSNVVVALATGGTDPNAFDMTLSTLAPTAVAAGSWGKLKTIYR